MIQTIYATDVTLRTLKQTLNLRSAPDLKFFSEWKEGLGTLSEAEQHYLDRVKTNFLDLLEDLPVLENSVKMVVLAPLLDLAGFYRRPWSIKTEASMEINLEDEGVV